MENGRLFHRIEKRGDKIGLFPRHTELLAPHVTVCRKGSIDRAAQIEFRYNGIGTQIDKLRDDP